MIFTSPLHFPSFRNYKEIGVPYLFMSRERKSDELLFRRLLYKKLTRLLYKKLTRYNNVSLTVNYVFVLPLLERAMSYSFGSCYKEGN